ncbi:ETS homologous factor-like isoform X3 [Ostrea edulis]|uniref:ETS homologous factor-like isoform X3 n=1 Tax=Ostrea edulis TaxID=37623 RepID=UPI0020959C8D|nr:ETS homologous factor-like isoform X3 [Ostrea edulis]
MNEGIVALFCDKMDALTSAESQNPQGSDVVFPVDHVTTNLRMPSVSPSQYICDMLDPLFEESYIEGNEYTGQQQQSHLENIVDSTSIFCANNNINGTETGKMRGESPDTACKVTDSADFYQGYQAQSYPTDYSEGHERLTHQGNYEVSYCAKIMDTNPVCEDRNAAYDRQYLTNKRTKYTDSNEFARWSNKHPETWSSQEVLDWIFYTAEKNGIDCEHLYAENFRNIAGFDLCKMGLDGFLRLEPNYGRLFYKMFRDLCDGLFFHQRIETPSHHSPKANDLSFSPTKPRENIIMNSESAPLAPSYYTVPDMAKMETTPSQYMYEIPGMTQYKCRNMHPMSNPFQATHLKHHPLPPYGHIPSQIMYPNMPRCIPYPTDEHLHQPIRRRPGRPRTKSHPSEEENHREKKVKNQHLWEFIYEILMNPMYNPQFLRWENQREGVFRFVQSEAVAQLWGGLKNNENMTYEKLSRAMRHYYKRGILERVEGRRLVYKFSRVAMERVREKRHSI